MSPRSEAKSARSPMAVSGAIYAAALLVMVVTSVLPLMLGVCAPAVDNMADTASTIAACITALGPLPQVILLCRTGDAGSLSVVNLVVESAGSFGVAVELLEERARIWTCAPYLSSCFSGLLRLVMVMYFNCRARHRKPVGRRPSLTQMML